MMHDIAGPLAIGRRGFLGGLAAAAACPAIADDGKPIFKVGLVTDTHVRKTRKSCERVELAYRLFKKHGVEMIVNCGDIADKLYPEGYAHYCAVRRETYPDPAKAPRELYVWANHDRMAYPEDDSKNPFLAFPKVKDASCLLTDAPNIVEEKQLEELGIDIKVISNEEE